MLLSLINYEFKMQIFGSTISEFLVFFLGGGASYCKIKGLKLAHSPFSGINTMFPVPRTIKLFLNILLIIYQSTARSTFTSVSEIALCIISF